MSVFPKYILYSFFELFFRKGFVGWCQTKVAKIYKWRDLNKVRGAEVGKKIEKLISVPLPFIKHPRVVVCLSKMYFFAPFCY